jgi:U11/U12 small nuclear ribonucleoprotein SNRNP35
MWFARVYDPVQVGSIDGTDRIPHDRAITRATKAYCKSPNFQLTW